MHKSSKEPEMGFFIKQLVILLRNYICILNKIQNTEYTRLTHVYLLTENNLIPEN